MAGSFLSCRACLSSTVRVATYNSTAAYLGRQSGRSSYATAIHATDRPVDAPQTLDVPDQDATVLQQKQREKLQRAVKKHLTHMDDPWKIAQHIEQTLLKDRFDEALLLTQKASKDGQVVVAWNHLIGYQLEKQRLKQAIKLFNDASIPPPSPSLPLLSKTRKD